MPGKGNAVHKFMYLLLFKEEKSLGLKYSRSAWKSENSFNWHRAETKLRPYTSIRLGAGFCARSSFSALNCSTWAILGEGRDVTESWQIPWQSQCRMGQSQTDFQTIADFGSKCPELRIAFFQARCPCSPGTGSLNGLGEQWAIC